MTGTMLLTAFQPLRTVPARTAAGSEPPVLRARGVCREFEGRRVLNAVDLELPRGTMCALLGSNGAGKTSLLRIFAQATQADEGTIELFGRESRRQDCASMQRIGYIAHQSMLYGDLTCHENLVFFAKLWRVPEPRERSRALLGLLGIEPLGDVQVRTLSRGMCQRVAVARALVHDPLLLLADEPFNGLDESSAAHLEEILVSMCGRGRTVLVTDHCIERAMRMCGRAVVLRQGCKVLDAGVGSLRQEDIARAIGGDV